MNITSAIALLGITQGFFFFFLLASSKKNRYANRILAAFMFFQAIVIAANSVVTYSIKLPVPHLFLVDWPLSMVLGPLFYFYIRAMIDRSFRIRPVHLLLFSTALLSFLDNLGIYMLSGQEKELFIKAKIFGEAVLPGEKAFPASSMLSVPGIQIQMIIYIIISIRRILKYRKALLESHSSLENKSLNWLLLMSVLMIPNYLVNFIGVLLTVTGFIRIPWKDTAFIPVVGFTVILYIIGYKSLKQNESTLSETDTQLSSKRVKYRKAGLNDEKIDSLFNLTCSKMEVEKLFMDPDLTIEALAERLGISKHHISQAINIKTGSNFYLFVNSYRISAAIKMLKTSGDQTNILSIAFKSGFDSKSAFYSAFKKIMGTAPGEYLKTIAQ